AGPRRAEPDSACLPGQPGGQSRYNETPQVSGWGRAAAGRRVGQPGAVLVIGHRLAGTIRPESARDDRGRRSGDPGTPERARDAGVRPPVTLRGATPCRQSCVTNETELV